jgi:copper chaperone CopZ
MILRWTSTLFTIAPGVVFRDLFVSLRIRPGLKQAPVAGSGAMRPQTTERGPDLKACDFYAPFRGINGPAPSVGRAAPMHPPHRNIIKRVAGEQMAEFTLRIDGMHCGSCIRRVSQALASAQGVTVKEVRIGAARLSAATDPPPVDLTLAALAKAGYPARLDR